MLTLFYGLMVTEIPTFKGPTLTVRKTVKMTPNPNRRGEDVDLIFISPCKKFKQNRLSGRPEFFDLKIALKLPIRGVTKKFQNKGKCTPAWSGTDSSGVGDF
jgi:hypothetical protein